MTSGLINTFVAVPYLFVFNPLSRKFISSLQNSNIGTSHGLAQQEGFRMGKGFKLFFPVPGCRLFHSGAERRNEDYRRKMIFFIFKNDIHSTLNIQNPTFPKSSHHKVNIFSKT
jgi:hypothetical protein